MPAVIATKSINVDGIEWTGPLTTDYDVDPGLLLHPVPGERWPYGPSQVHQECCYLFSGGLYCDCAASDASDATWGMAWDKTGVIVTAKSLLNSEPAEPAQHQPSDYKYYGFSSQDEMDKAIRGE